MPNPKKVHRRDITLGDHSLFFFLISVAIGLAIFLAWKEVNAGYIYFSMFVGIIALMFLALLWMKDDDSLKPITEYIRIPLSSKLTIGTFMYFTGLCVPFLLFFIVKLIGMKFGISYNITRLSVPIFGNAIDNAFTDYSVANIENSMAWKIVLVMFEAGTLETFVYQVGIPIISVIFGLMFFKLFTRGKEQSTVLGMSRKIFVLIFSVFVMPVLLFTLSHQMNATYTLKEYISASVFLMLSNSSLYVFGFMVLFWVGYHQSNNLLALIIKYGFADVMKGFASWFGLLFIPFILLIFFFFITRLPQTGYDIRDWWKSKKFS